MNAHLRNSLRAACRNFSAHQLNLKLSPHCPVYSPQGLIGHYLSQYSEAWALKKMFFLGLTLKYFKQIY